MAQALINGIAYDWASIEINIGGAILIGVKSISYEENFNATNNYGKGSLPVSRGYGAQEFTGSLEVDRTELNALLSASGNSLRNTQPFDIVVAYAPLGAVPVVDILRGVSFSNTVSGASQGDTESMSTLNLTIAKIDWNV